MAYSFLKCKRQSGIIKFLGGLLSNVTAATVLHISIPLEFQAIESFMY